MPTQAIIVVVDDQRWVRDILRSLLAEQRNWRVYDAGSGKRALDLIPKVRPHVVVLDLLMPEMNGIEVAYEIRQLENAPKIVLISSHYSPEEAVVLARLFGDGNFVPKSEAAKSLVPAIDRLLPEECQAKATAV